MLSKRIGPGSTVVVTTPTIVVGQTNFSLWREVGLVVSMEGSGKDATANVDFGPKGTHKIFTRMLAKKGTD